MANFNEKSISSLERKVISDILNDPEVLDNITNKLEPQDFLNKELGIIFSAAQALNKEAKAVDPHTVINYLDSHDELQFDGYSEIIISLYNQFTTSIDVDDHVDLIKNASIKRKMDAFASKIVETKFDPTIFADQMFNMEQEFMAIAGSKKNIKLKRIGDVTASYQDKLNTILDQDDGGYFGTTSGYADIDKITNGFQPGDLIILAARPGVGKTALALNFLLNAAEDIKKKQVSDPTAKKDVVVMFSLEMGAEQLCQRLVSMHSLIDLSYRNIKNISTSEWHAFTDSITQINELPILIDDSSDISILDIQSQLKQISNNYNIKLVVVDYLQLLRGPKSTNQMNRQQEVAFISRTLKAIARDPKINTPIIAIAQLSRAIEQRRGDRPMLSDLRESGAIEQDADLVTFISYKNNNQEDFGDNQENKDEVVKNNDYQIGNMNPIVEYSISKHRNGPTGIVELTFNKQFGKYLEIEKAEENKYNN